VLLKVRKKVENNEMKDNDGDSNEMRRTTVDKRTIATFHSEPSSPLLELFNTYVNQNRNTISTFSQHHLISVQVISLTRDQWKKALSPTDK
jgi:hypothetical protein